MHKLIYEEYHSVKHEVDKLYLVIFCPFKTFFFDADPHPNPESWIRSKKNRIEPDADISEKKLILKQIKIFF